MTEERPLSEAAQWFLQDFKKLLSNFAKAEEASIFLADKEGNLILYIPGPQKACVLIGANSEGRIRCNDSLRIAFSLVREQKKPIFIDCYAGFACVWMPIIAREQVIGVVISCGGRYDRGETRKQLEERFSKLADELGIMNKQEFVRTAIDETKIVTQKETKERAEKLKKLLDILAETALTPLKEVFG